MKATQLESFKSLGLNMEDNWSFFRPKVQTLFAIAMGGGGRKSSKLNQMSYRLEKDM